MHRVVFMRSVASADRRFIAGVLHDVRGWPSQGHVFTIVPDVDGVDITIDMSSPEQLRTMFGDTFGDLSVTRMVPCPPRSIYFNALNWSRVPPTSEFKPHQLTRYRVSLVLHEVGHALGLLHASCPVQGGLADIMQQPSRPLHGCLPRTWLNDGLV